MLYCAPFNNALWSPAGEGLTSWFSFVMSNCEVVTFMLVSWVRCGAWLYRFLICAFFLTLLGTFCFSWLSFVVSKCEFVTFPLGVVLDRIDS